MSEERVIQYSLYARVPADQAEPLAEKIEEYIEQLLCPEDSRTTHGDEHECRWPWTFGGSSRPYDPEHEDWIASVEEEVDAASAVIWKRRRKEHGLPA